MTQDSNPKSEREEMLQSARSISALMAILAICLAIIGVIPTIYFKSAGEFYNIDDVVKEQISSPENQTVIFGPAYTYPVEYYKKLSIQTIQPTIFTVGTSRVMLFRNELFKDKEKFYNGGGLMYTLDELEPFLKMIRETHVNKTEQLTVIVGIDHNMLNAQWLESRVPQVHKTSSILTQLSQLRNNIVPIYLDIFVRNKINLNSLKNNDKDIGIRAKIYGSGYLRDGSAIDTITDKLHESQNYSWEGENFSYTQASLDHGAGPFRAGPTVSTLALKQLNDALTYANNNNISIIGILPSYPHKIWTQLDTLEKFSYIDNLNSSLTSLFNNHGFDFYDYSDGEWLSATDCEFIDGLHGSQKTAARTMLSIAMNNETLRTAINTEFIENGLDNFPSCIRIS